MRTLLRARWKLAATLGLTVAIASVTAGVSSGDTRGTHPHAIAAKDNTLVIYGNPPPAQFKPVLDAFSQAYPNVQVKYSDQEDNVSFSKYRAEHAQHARTADIIIASSPMNWKNNRGIALPWKPKDAGAFPGFRNQFPGVFVFSPDPAVSVYSKAKLPANRVPHTFRDLIAFVKKYPDLFKKKTVTFSVDNQFGYTAFWGLVKKRGWGPLDTLGPVSKPQADGTAIVVQVLKGAANYGFLESGLVRRALTGDVGKVVGWTYMKDFTPLVPRGIAVTKGAANPGAAKSFLNWAYGAGGQQVMCAAGFTAFRRGVNCPNSLSSIERAVGAKNVFLVPFNSTIANDHKSFTARWHKAFH
jgi:iron(III) transport system substrate-binding protein